MSLFPWRGEWPSRARRCCAKWVVVLDQFVRPIGSTPAVTYSTRAAASGDLIVERNGDFWVRSRWEKGAPTKVLVFGFGSTPIFTRTYQAAIRLAKHCAFDHPQPFGYRWVTARPVNLESAVAFAKQRDIDEVNAAANAGPQVGYRTLHCCRSAGARHAVWRPMGLSGRHPAR